MKQIQDLIAQVSLFLGIIVIVGLSLSAIPHLSNEAFLSNFLSNLLATAAGIIVGIPIALLISRIQQKQQDERELVVKNNERKKKQTRLLHLLASELEHNLNVLKERQEGMSNTRDYINFPGAKNELWTAFSDGGELQSIDDLELLDVVSHAHYYIRWVIQLEHHYFDPLFRNGVVRADKDGNSINTMSGVDTIVAMERILPEAIPNIRSALERLNLTLASVSC